MLMKEYCKLNKKVVRDRFPLPRISAPYLCKSGLRSQIDVNEDQVGFSPERPEASALEGLPPLQELPEHFPLVLHAWHTISVNFKLKLAERKWLVVFLGVLDQ